MSLRNTSRYVDVTYWTAESYIKRIISGSPLFISYLPGYKSFPLEFPKFFILWTGEGRLSSSLEKTSLLDWKGNVINTYLLPDGFSNRKIVFIIWPWQFGEYISLGRVHSSSSFYFLPQNKELFLEDREIELFFPQRERKIVLRAINNYA